MLENNINGELLLFGELQFNCCWCCLLRGAQANKVLDILSQSQGEYFILLAH